MGKTADYYKKNPKAKAKKLAYDKKYQKKDRVKKYQRKLKKKRYKDAKKGNPRAQKGSGYDYDHGSKRYLKASKNRGKTSGTPGDKRARGKGNKKKK